MFDECPTQCQRCAVGSVNGKSPFCLECSATVNRIIQRMHESDWYMSEIGAEVGLSANAVAQRLVRMRRAA